MSFFFDDDQIDCANPLNVDSEFNRNLVARWIVLPGLSGGTWWHNLVSPQSILPGHYHALRTTTGADTFAQAPYFVLGSGRPGGFGYVVCPGLTSPTGLWDCGQVATGSSDYSMGVWINPISHNDNNNTILSQEVSGNDFSFLVNPTDHFPRMYQNPGNLVGTTALNIGTWYHLVVTWTANNSGLLSIYVNGLLNASGTGFTSRNTGSSVNFCIGFDPTFNRVLNAQLDDAFFMSRWMNAGEVQRFYVDSATHHMDTLNRMIMPALSPTSSVAFRRTLSQFGARVGTRQIQGI